MRSWGVTDCYQPGLFIARMIQAIEYSKAFLFKVNQGLTTPSSTKAKILQLSYLLQAVSAKEVQLVAVSWILSGNEDVQN